ncbi:hypothetical protein RhiirC2_799650 [Rhizophagus irregularis]|uniref:Uncharacterized protein n=1 Tax=Rhizophagus irregularis TaxID=588596 RepID=A0A2N1M4M9_9GLOM|nr:hypothetical protein RhiirC2_799650 [Rhizophagus irregularis]
MAVRYREYFNLIFMDDKHRCKVREPGYLVAAVEQEKSVIVANGATFDIADHDFMKCELIPSVIMHAKIPQSIDESFYHGKVYMGLKDPVFELSNAARHATELYEIVAKTNKPYLFLYMNGGPDHKVKFIKTQLALIMERIMSILNLGLQCVGLIRQEMDVELEEIMSKCNSMNDIRKMAEKTPSLKEDPTLTKDDRNWTNIKISQLVISLTTIVVRIPIFFSIKKCNKDDCEICLPIRSPQDIFNTLDHLPDPVSANNEHYKNFSDIYHMNTENAYQRAKNVGITVTCMDCNKSKYLYASKKITEDEKKIFMAHLNTVCYTCGATFSQNDNGFKMELKDDSLEESS